MCIMDIMNVRCMDIICIWRYIRYAGNTSSAEALRQVLRLSVYCTVPLSRVNSYFFTEVQLQLRATKTVP